MGFLGTMEVAWQFAAPVSAIAFACIVLVLLSTVLHRLIFHPLAAHPGPLLAKCTSWYAAYQSYTGNIHRDILRCHELYGDIVRYRPNGLLFNNVEGTQDIYASPAKTRKSRGYFNFREDGTVSILSAMDKEEHAPRRRLLSRAFSVAALQKYGPLISKTARVFCNSLLERVDHIEKDDQWGPSINIGTLSSYFTFDVMSSCVFYSPKNLITNAQGRQIVEDLDGAMFVAGISLEQPSILDFPILQRILFPSFRKQKAEFQRKTREFALNRLSLGKDHPVDDIFGNLIGQGHTKDHGGLSTSELSADGAVMIAAGTDTSSVAISSCFFYLSRQPDAYAKLASEIRTTFETAEEISPGPKLTSCVYLRACIDESLRLSPPVAAPLWREMNQEDVVAGMIVPKGTDVATCIYSIQRNPGYFSDPNEFKPERWLQGFQHHASAELAKRAFMPFSLGSRGCIGKNLAYLELSIVLAQIIYRADWKAAGGPLGKIGEMHPVGAGPAEYQLRGHFTSGKTGPFLQFMPRSL